ncbi:hypothetical protein AB6N24_09915 [Cellulomonas sp. 179-A 4D5 NHS]
MRILAYAGRIGPDRTSRANDSRDVDELDEDRDALAVVVGLRDRRSTR